MSSLDIRCADNHLRHPERIIFGNDDAHPRQFVGLPSNQKDRRTSE